MVDRQRNRGKWKERELRVRGWRRRSRQLRGLHSEICGLPAELPRLEQALGFLFSSLGSRGAAGRVLALAAISPGGSAKPGTLEPGPRLRSDSEAGPAPPCCPCCSRPPPCRSAGLALTRDLRGRLRGAPGQVQRPLLAGPGRAGAGERRDRVQTRPCPDEAVRAVATMPRAL